MMTAYMTLLSLTTPTAQANPRAETMAEARAQDHLTLMAGASALPVRGDLLVGGVVGRRFIAEISAAKHLSFLRWGAASEYGLKGRIFLGNTFSFTVGPSLRGFRTTRPIDELFEAVLLGPDRTIESTRGHELAVDAAIGNRWQWGAFVLGVDWIEYSHRVAALDTAVLTLRRMAGEPGREVLERRPATAAEAARGWGDDLGFLHLRAGIAF